MTTRTHTYDRGAILLLALVIASVMTTSFVGLVGYTTLYAKSERSTIASTQALSLAEAGIDKAVYQLNQNSGYTGETGTSLGAGTFTTTVASIDASTKRITSTGYVPNGTSPVATRSVIASVGINTSVVSFNFGAQIGSGGMTMNNNSTVTGNIFSDGNISGSGTITGSATVAAGTQANPDQQWTTQNSSINLGDITARSDVAMSFKPSASSTLNDVRLYLKKVGTPDDITIEIVADNGGVPATTTLATGDIRASSVTSSYSYADVTLASLPTLTAGQTYWIIAVATVSASNYFIWGEDSGNGYANGAGLYSNSWDVGVPAWSATKDLDFKTYMGGVVTSISGVTVQGNAWAHALSNCTIGGNATYQTLTSCSVGGTSTHPATDPAPAVLPISDAQIEDWETTAAAGGVIAGPYTISGSQTLGPKEINGNLTVSNGGTLIISGPIWVNGTVSFSNNATMKVALSTGNNGAVLVADAPANPSGSGTISVSNNVTITGNGNSGSYPMLLSTNTGNNAISISNNGGSVILYASKGTISLSNNAGANEVTGYGLSLSNGVTITYVNGLQSASFSNGPGGSWAFIPGTYAITK